MHENKKREIFMMLIADVMMCCL